MPAREETPFKVLILGGSYAGLAAALNLVDLCHGRKCRFSVDKDDNGPGKTIPVQVTIVDERDGFYHLLGVPLAIASEKHANTFWSRFADIPALQTQDIRLVQGRVKSIDCENKTAKIISAKGMTAHESYDYLITCTGLKRDWPSAPCSLTKEKYLLEAMECLRQIEGARDEGVVVIGGGAVGIEIASEIKTLYPSLKVTLVHSRNTLLSSESLPSEFSTRTLSILQSTCGVNTVLGVRVQSTTGTPGNYTITLSDNTTLRASYVINAVSRFTPTAPTFLPTSICDEDGYVRITPQLEFPLDGDIANAADHYAAGDVARWTGVKRAGAAMHQGHCAARNIHQKMMQKVYGIEPAFVSLAEVQPGMGLAVGESAVGYFAGMGMMEGEKVREMFFEDDMGFMICWRWMQLGNVTE